MERESDRGSGKWERRWRGGERRKINSEDGRRTLRKKYLVANNALVRICFAVGGSLYTYPSNVSMPHEEV